jgi:hypothetical protein
MPALGPTADVRAEPNPTFSAQANPVVTLFTDFLETLAL